MPRMVSSGDDVGIAEEANIKIIIIFAYWRQPDVRPHHET